MTEHEFWRTYGRIEEILSTYFRKTDSLEMYCYVSDSESLSSSLAINVYDRSRTKYTIRHIIPATIWLTQEPEVTAEQFILEYTFL